MPNSFAMDGALGGWGGGGADDASAPTPSGGDPVSNPFNGGGTSAISSLAPWGQSYQTGNLNLPSDPSGGGGSAPSSGSNSNYRSYAPNTTSLYPTGYGGGGQNGPSIPSGIGMQDTTGMTPWSRQFLQNTGGFSRTAMFAGGGAVPDGLDDGASGSDYSDVVAQAMDSIDQALAYGRKKYGLGGGQQQAANMPAIPGTQSNSGMPSPRPAPGPLPPTSNPFGQRVIRPLGQNDDEQDQQQQASNKGAIPDDDGDEQEAA